MVSLFIAVKYINYTLYNYKCKGNWEKQLISLQFEEMLCNPHLVEMQQVNVVFLDRVFHMTDNTLSIMLSFHTVIQQTLIKHYK